MRTTLRGVQNSPALLRRVPSANLPIKYSYASHSTSVATVLLPSEIAEATTRLELPGRKRDEDRERLRATVARLGAEIARLTEALATGGSLPTIIAAIREREAQRAGAPRCGRPARVRFLRRRRP
jgi:hypothetical protein